MLKYEGVTPMLKITSENVGKPLEIPNAVTELFQPINNFEIETDSSIGSDIEDVFEQIHKTGFPDPNQARGTNNKKIEANQLIVDRFTDDYKQTMIAVRQDSKIDHDLINESMQDIINKMEGPRQSYEFPTEVADKIAEILTDPDLVIDSPPRLVESAKVSSMSYDYMSGVWNMIEAECDGKSFNVTPQEFDVYKQDEPHWLQRPEFSRESLNSSKSKCEFWLREHQN